MADSFDDKVNYDHEDYFDKNTPIGECSEIQHKIGIALYPPSSVKELAAVIIPDDCGWKLDRIFDSPEGGCELLKLFKSYKGQAATLNVLKSALNQIKRLDLITKLNELKKNKQIILVHLKRGNKKERLSEEEVTVQGRRPIWRHLMNWLYKVAKDEMPMKEKYYFRFITGVQKWIDVGQDFKGADTGIKLLEQPPPQQDLRIIFTQNSLRIYLDKNFELLVIDYDPEPIKSCSDQLSSISLNGKRRASCNDASQPLDKSGSNYCRSISSYPSNGRFSEYGNNCSASKTFVMPTEEEPQMYSSSNKDVNALSGSISSPPCRGSEWTSCKNFNIYESDPDQCKTNKRGDETPSNVYKTEEDDVFKMFDRKQKCPENQYVDTAKMQKQILRKPPPPKKPPPPPPPPPPSQSSRLSSSTSLQHNEHIYEELNSGNEDPSQSRPPNPRQ